MTDEETDAESNSTGFIQRTPKWRSNKLSKLLAKLDEKYHKSSKTDKARPTKPRRSGPYSDRMPPLNAPKWALSEEFEEAGSSNAESSVIDTTDEPQSLTDSGNDIDDSLTMLTPHNHTSNDINCNAISDDQSDDDDDEEDSQWLFNVAGIERQ